MRPGREMDARIAKEVFGYNVWAQAKVLWENADKGDRPLRNYTKEMEWAAEVMEKMKITLIPIEGGQWFAFSGPASIHGWESPQAVLKFLEAGRFEGCGAAVGDKLPQVICEAALRAVEKRTNAVAPEAGTDAGMGADTANETGTGTQHAPPPLHVVESMNLDEPTPEQTH